ncbi:MAG: IMP dehydrogenase [Candidatus Daviesbacteria bacterium]
MAKSKLHQSLLDSEFTLDDIVFPPLEIPNFEWKDVDLTTKLTKNLTLKSPLMSSPMDTVTGSEMAILMALLGGIGVIHYNFPTLEDQIREVEKVRRFEAGFVLNPVVLNKNATVGTVFEAADKNGFFSYPITLDGTLKTPMIGFVTRRDVRYQEDLGKSVLEVMTPKAKLIVAHKRNTLDKNDIRAANKIIRDHNLDTLPIVDDQFRVVALVTDSDLSKDEKYPVATKDQNQQLKVLVAVESRLKTAQERIMAAKAAGASGIVVDARNIFQDHLEIAKWSKKHAPDLEVILGNVVTKEVVVEAMKYVGKFIDAFRIGMGTGETCVTTESLGLGRSLGSAVYEVAQALIPFKKKFGHIGLIADGGIKTPHHIVGALMLGSDCAMMGSELAGLEESPIRAEYNSERQQMIKTVRGMGSVEAIREKAGANRYMVTETAALDRFPEGIKKTIAYKGAGEPYLKMLIAGIRQAFHGLGYKNIGQLQTKGIAYLGRKAISKGTL